MSNTLYAVFVDSTPVKTRGPSSIANQSSTPELGEIVDGRLSTAELRKIVERAGRDRRN
ncbi:hypothetical protein YC2023_075680 [Brassica napus]